jgi:factor associated with neutral sphingomyelinase activation
MQKNKTNPQFFWDEKNSKKNRSRFNLLLLEYGEYFLEDLSVYFFPLPTNDLTKVFEFSDSLKIQGRLKLSTRSLIFEPTDIRFPLIKFPYKSMTTSLETFNLKPSELKTLTVEVSGFFTFMCNNYFEIKANDKIGPYKLIDNVNTSGSTGNRVVFALVHSNLVQFLVKVEQFRHIFSVLEKKGSAQANQLLKPFIDTALITSFDTSHLVDFHEKLLLVTPIAVKKIKPLIINPGL